jgi:UDP-N-acetylmuramoyl-tripeptide--D-alanyl-D-alanine ligase
MKEASTRLLAEWCGGTWRPGAPERGVDRLSFDSREAAPGVLFFALKGEKRDGHEFVPAVLRAGGCAVVCRGAVGLPPNAAVLEVDDPLEALGRIAAGWRQSMVQAKVVGVTGSAGKTSTKELCANVLSRLGPTVRTAGNFNNHIGLPLSVSRLDPDTAYGVFEAGVSHPGEMPPLRDIMMPDVAVVTGIGPAHIEFFGTERAIAEEKSQLLARLPRGGFAVLGADMPHFDVFRDRVPEGASVVTCSRTADIPADYAALHAPDGNMLVREASSGEEALLPVPPPGGYMAGNALRAVALGRRLGASWDDIRAGLAEGVRTGMRWELVSLPGGRSAVNDAYNANPLSMRESLRAFAEHPCTGRRFLALGPMRELGERGPDEHAALGRDAVSIADWAGVAIVAGPEPTLADALARGFRDAGLPADRLLLADTHAPAAAWLASRMVSGDALLLKGSRAIAMEKIIDFFKN